MRNKISHLSAVLFASVTAHAALAQATGPMQKTESPSATVRADENDSVSPQARKLLAMLQGLKGRGGFEEQEGPLTAEEAQKQRQLARQYFDAPTQAAVKAKAAAVERKVIGGVPVIEITPKSFSAASRGRIAIYIHGGGYTTGEALGPMVLAIAQQSGLRTISVDYRLAPENPFPAGRDDCLVVYRQLVKTVGASHIVMVGESAGGGMVLATVLAARDAGIRMPAAVALMSPWSDLTRTGDSYYGNEGRDPVLSWHSLQRSADAYSHGKDPKSSDLSPIYADYKHGFPPTLITAGTRDLFLSNCVRLSRAMKQADVIVDLEVWEGMWHVFQLFSGDAFTEALPEGDEGIAVVSAFLKTPPRLPKQH